MPNSTHLSGTRESAQKKNFVMSGVINAIKISNTMLHSLLGIKSVCRYEVTCSNYAIRAIEEKGIFKGSMVSLRRVINCQPFFRL